MRRILDHSLAPLILFSLALTVMFVAYLAGGASPSPTFLGAVSLLWPWLVALWIMADARRKSCVPCFDFGLYCYVLLPLTLPWYCLWSRGWRGLLTLVAIFALWYLPFVAAWIVWLAMYG